MPWNNLINYNTKTFSSFREPNPPNWDTTKCILLLKKGEKKFFNVIERSMQLVLSIYPIQDVKRRSWLTFNHWFQWGQNFVYTFYSK